jgi:hypothetical protein
MKLRNLLLAILALAAVALAQPAAADGPFQVGYAANLDAGESYINITNTGANGAPLLGPGFGGASGNICVNAYAFDPGEELISCCSCLVTPDQTVNLGVNRDLTVKTLTGVVPTSVTVKLLATLAGTNGTGTSCTNSAATVATATLAPGLRAWNTHLIRAFFLTTKVACLTAGGSWFPDCLTCSTGLCFASSEVPSTVVTVSLSEVASIGGRCASILGNGSGFGVCNSCQAGALGAAKQQ